MPRFISAIVAGLFVPLAFAAESGSPRSLRDAAAGVFTIGVGISDRIPERLADWSLLTAQFTSVTPENCLKPDPVQRAEGKFEFARPDAFVDFAAAILFASFGVALWQLTSLHPGWIYLIAVSVITFLFYGYDKFQARQNRTRIPELVLHLLALAGGTIGAFLGQILFHHKTKKWQFRLEFILIAIVQAGLIAWWWTKD